ncbi:Aste57867_15556 [Aphanomyces stellatus]|uniref:Aste57867_15556 protein n=1 Tax=Aphanomyces stellatus TaxID=120398 RepID=A0A485L4E4_9STRA|nr:hypothetical protein As57867_015500 [Aphanomyces stellatus]VFT92358.1 Aste57867_15556 [Aphanomyces stellatus]
MKLPPALRLGDTIAFFAPASGLAVPVVHRLMQGKAFFESRGYVVKLYPSCFASGAYSSTSGEERAAELMDAFQDPSVKALISTIGGLTSHEMLEFLDFDVLRAHPTIFCGFSDVTTLHLALHAHTELVTFYGPSVLCQFGEFPAPLPYTVDSFFRAVAAPPTPIGHVLPSIEWTDDKSINWFSKADMTTPRPMQPNTTGHEWLRAGAARVTAPLLGGCLPVLLNVFGTPHMPSLNGCILLLETPESDAAFDQGMSMDAANRCLGVLRANETLRHVRGVVVGRPFALSADQTTELKRLVLYHTRGYEYPIVFGVDCGHSDPLGTWPLGVPLTLDAAANVVSIDGPGVQ